MFSIFAEIFVSKVDSTDSMYVRGGMGGIPFLVLLLLLRIKKRNCFASLPLHVEELTKLLKLP